MRVHEWQWYSYTSDFPLILDFCHTNRETTLHILQKEQWVSPTRELELIDRGLGSCCIEAQSFWQHSNKECDTMMYNCLKMYESMMNNYTHDFLIWLSWSGMCNFFFMTSFSKKCKPINHERLLFHMQFWSILSWRNQASVVFLAKVTQFWECIRWHGDAGAYRREDNLVDSMLHVISTWWSGTSSISPNCESLVARNVFFVCIDTYNLIL